MGAGKTFVAARDINTLERAAWGVVDAACDLHPLLAGIEDCAKPVVMAIHGTALGGGLEIAMAGHFRVATPDALLGQPEVNLGIIPGAEGTQRLPRLVGVAKALDMCVTAKPLKAADAHAAGLIDRVTEGDPPRARQVCATVATTVACANAQLRAPGTPEENAPLFAAARELASKTRRRQGAPAKVIDAIAAATTLAFDEGCRRERALFFECVEGEQAKALIHIFFAERAVTKVQGLPKEALPRPIARVAVIGAGTMGGGIATACANAGLAVTVKDSTQEALDAGFATIRRNYDASVKRGRLTAEAAAERMGRMTPMLSYDGVATADLVIEAVFENLELKTHVFRELMRRETGRARQQYVDRYRFAVATGRPQDVVGLLSQPGEHHAPPRSGARQCGRRGPGDCWRRETARQVRSSPTAGVVGNRMMFPHMGVAQPWSGRGDAGAGGSALTNFGMAGHLCRTTWPDRRVAGAPGWPLQRTAVCGGWWLTNVSSVGYGQDGPRGYRYEQRKPPRRSSINVIDGERGRHSSTFDDREIVERCLYALVNEGARTVADGSAQ